MISYRAFAVIGGDLRHIKLADSLARDGFEVRTFALASSDNYDFHIKQADTLEEAIEGALCVILPLPCSLDGQVINSPFWKEKLTLTEIWKVVKPDQVVVGGLLPTSAFKAADTYGFKIFDYFAREELTVQNAVPTAEGALQIAMEELPVTIHGCKCLVIGYGRIGKVLSRNLACLSADVTVAARKYSDIAWIRTFGCNSILTEKIGEVLPKMSVVFNTVPSRVLGKELLTLLPRDALVIDLASKPGGVDLEAAGKLGIKTIWALSLPGKVAPVTSGEIIKDTVLNILTEEGV